MKYLIVGFLFALPLLFGVGLYTVTFESNMKLKQFHKECLLKNGEIKSNFYFTYCSTSSENIIFEDE